MNKLIAECRPVTQRKTNITANNALTLQFDCDKWMRGLFGIACLLVILNLIAVLCKHLSGHPNAWGIIPMFELDEERNIPTYFSSFILLLSSVLLMVLSVIKQNDSDKYSGHWRLLAALFFYLSIDESAGIHEMLIYPMRENFQLSGVLYFSWVIFGVIGVAGLGFYYLRFVFSLPPLFRNRVILAAFIYVAGALGIELLGGYYASNYTVSNLTYSLITTVEETMEITGVLLFVRALYKHLKNQRPYLTLMLTPYVTGLEQPQEDLLPQHELYQYAENHA